MGKTRILSGFLQLSWIFRIPFYLIIRILSYSFEFLKFARILTNISDFLRLLRLFSYFCVFVWGFCWNRSNSLECFRIILYSSAFSPIFPNSLRFVWICSYPPFFFAKNRRLSDSFEIRPDCFEFFLILLDFSNFLVFFFVVSFLCLSISSDFP